MNQFDIYHDSHNIYYRQPFGAVTCRQRIILRLEIESIRAADQVLLRMWKNDSREEKVNMLVTHVIGRKRVYQVEIIAPSQPGLLWYFFIIKFNGQTYYYGNNQQNYGGVGKIYQIEPPSYQVTVYKEQSTTPNWFKDAIIYQIFVDRFFNGNEEGQLLNPKSHCYLYKNWHDKPYYRNDPTTGKIVCYDFFGGNLLGVIKKLPYLKELGINVIYFNPIFEAPSNHKYDTADYKKIDPMYGDNNTFHELCCQAKQLGIAIILDGVFSHTGSNSRYFNKEGQYPDLGAYQSQKSPYYPWYIFKNYPDEYQCWWGIDTLPNVNEMEPSYQNFIIYDQDSVIRYWMKLGAKGWRLDVADELPEQFIKGIKQVMQQTDPESILIGEVWEDASRKISYGKMRHYLLGDELDSVMNYPLRNILLNYLLGLHDAHQTHRALMSLYENYPKHHFYSNMNLVGTHDVPRILTLLGEAPPENQLSPEQRKCFILANEQEKLAIARLKLLVLFQMTFPGVPAIYYGDEVGMQGYGDPYCRATYPWGQENLELLNWYKMLISYRHRYDLLKTGEWTTLYAHQDVYAYLRIIKNGRDIFGQSKKSGVAVVVLNRSKNREYHLSLEVRNWCQKSLIDLLDNNKEVPIKAGKLDVLIKPLQGKLFIDH
ncbi:glycoside hydrolase family 13 protein [Peptococcaceae bacterium 1198_IL3148]